MRLEQIVPRGDHVAAFIAGGAVFIAASTFWPPLAVILAGGAVFTVSLLFELGDALLARQEERYDREVAERRWAEWGR